MKIKCDKCNKMFTPKLHLYKYKGIHTTYLKCEHCKAEYKAYKTNKAIRGLQHRLKLGNINLQKVENEILRAVMKEKLDKLREQLNEEWKKLNE